jgi:hypothetical protein
VTQFNQPEPLAPIEEIFPVAASRWTRYTAIGLLVISSLMLGVIVTALKAPPALAYNDLPWRVDGPKTFYAGQVVPIKVDRCNGLSRQMIYTVTRTLKNIETGETYVFPSTKVAIEPGCHQSVSRLHLLPEDLAPGTYQAAGVGTVQGAFNDIDIPFYTEPFNVKAIPTGPAE